MKKIDKLAVEYLIRGFLIFLINLIILYILIFHYSLLILLSKDIIGVLKIINLMGQL